MSFLNRFRLNNVWLSIDKIVRLIIATSLILLISYGNANADKSGIIKIPLHNWSSQIVGAQIVGELMKMIGEKVEYIRTDSKKVYQLMADGDIDLVHAIWEPAFGEYYDKAKAAGGIEEILTHEAITREEWWYPDYVEQICEGLPSWKALAKCSSKFARTDSDGKGIFIGGPKNWLKHNVERIEALKMDFVVKHVSSVGALWAELDMAISQKKPIVVYNWIPNFVSEKYSGKFIKFPSYDIRCTTDPSWGLNPSALYDCGNPESSYLKLAVNKDFEKNHPKGYALIKQINFTGQDINKMAYYVDALGLEVSIAVQKWLTEHKSKWSRWVQN